MRRFAHGHQPARKRVFAFRLQLKYDLMGTEADVRQRIGDGTRRLELAIPRIHVYSIRGRTACGNDVLAACQACGNHRPRPLE